MVNHGVHSLLSWYVPSLFLLPTRPEEYRVEADDQNWTPKAIITMIACVITALLGFGTVIWYGSGDLDEAEIEEEVKRKMEAKQAKQDKVRRLVGI
jgi:hypothetical protein